MTFPDVSKAMAWDLASLAGGRPHSGTETPAQLQDFLHFIRVGRTSGPDNKVTDFPVVDVDYFAATRDEAVDGADRVRDYLTAGYHFIQYPGLNGAPKTALLDSVTTVVGPRQLVWLNPNIVRITGTYRVETRRS